MNTKNNKRKRESKEKIEREFMDLLQSKNLPEITVSEICQMTGLNRSTFYANYLDIYDLADKIMEDLVKDLQKEYAKEWETRSHSYDYLKLFRHIKANQLFYKTFFKLDYDNSYKSVFYNPEFLREQYTMEHMDYHIEFFKSGLTAMINLWLKNGCKESPEDMVKILETEFSGRSLPLR